MFALVKFSKTFALMENVDFSILNQFLRKEINFFLKHTAINTNRHKPRIKQVYPSSYIDGKLTKSENKVTQKSEVSKVMIFRVLQLNPLPARKSFDLLFIPFVYDVMRIKRENGLSFYFGF